MQTKQHGVWIRESETGEDPTPYPDMTIENACKLHCWRLYTAKELADGINVEAALDGTDYEYELFVIMEHGDYGERHMVVKDMRGTNR